ncbi:MAG TPA: hypothetical protein PL090_06700, partial [Syntrophales bacterium]|nr:hypothetical protein [Syntrophales bacterium]
EDRLLLLVARMIREDFLMQSAYHPVDTYTPPERSHKMLATIIRFADTARELSEQGMMVNEIQGLKIVPRISRMKDVPLEELDTYIKDLWSDMEKLVTTREGGM